MQILKYNLDDINYYINEVDIFIGCVSYEDRCLSIAEKLNTKNLEQAIIIENEGFGAYNQKNKDRLYGLFSDNLTLVTTSTESPIKTADNIFAAINNLSNKNILIDITTFTHESLLILCKIIEFTVSQNNAIKFVYTSSADYGKGNTDEIWLSKGVSEIRSVLGYSGDPIPSQQTHLIVLVGYEHERALKLIELYEPNILSLGYGKSGSETDPKHRIAMEYFYGLLKKATNMYSNVNDFSFSCSNPLETQKAILTQVDNFSGYNSVVSPMSTKLSTIGCALAVRANPSIQIYYARANQYNIKNYSIPGSHCYLVELPELFDK